MNKNSSGATIGLLDVLAVVFIVLKLCGVINWSWVWVLAPIWIQVLLIVVVVIIAGAIESHNRLKEQEWQKKRGNL